MSSVTSPRSGIWFVYRSLYEGMAGKRIRRLPDATVLAWFQRMWAATAGVVDLDTDDRWAWATLTGADKDRAQPVDLAAELDGEVYGLGSVFVSARERGPGPSVVSVEVDHTGGGCPHALEPREHGRVREPADPLACHALVQAAVDEPDPGSGACDAAHLHSRQASS